MNLNLVRVSLLSTMSALQTTGSGMKKSLSCFICTLLLFTATSMAHASTVLAEWSTGTVSILLPNTNAFGVTVTMEFGYFDSLTGYFSGQSFATTTDSFNTNISTNDAAGLAALNIGILDAIDDTLLVVTTVSDANGTISSNNTTFLESDWIAGGDMGLTGSDISEFTITGLLFDDVNFSLRQQATSAQVTYSPFIQLLGEPTVVPVPASAWLFVSGLIGLAGVARRKVTTRLDSGCY